MLRKHALIAAIIAVGSTISGTIGRAAIVESDAVKPLASDPAATNSAYQTFFDGNISATDLLQTASPIVTTTGTNSNAAAYNGTTPPGPGGYTGIYDGSASTKAYNTAVNNLTNDTFFSNADLTAATPPSITFTFPVPQTITQIRSIAGWGDGSTFSNQKYQVFINGSATPLASVNYAPNPSTNATLNGSNTNNVSPHSSQVLLADSSGTLATGVSSIRFLFQSNGGNGQVIREIDVIPEPASLTLFGLGGVGLLARRRRSR